MMVRTGVTYCWPARGTHYTHFSISSHLHTVRRDKQGEKSSRYLVIVWYHWRVLGLYNMSIIWRPYKLQCRWIFSLIWVVWKVDLKPYPLYWDTLNLLGPQSCLEKVRVGLTCYVICYWIEKMIFLLKASDWQFARFSIFATKRIVLISFLLKPPNNSM